jgi:hypothetical protein
MRLALGRVFPNAERPRDWSKVSLKKSAAAAAAVVQAG